MFRSFAGLVSFLILAPAAWGQHEPDSIRVQHLEPVTVRSYRQQTEAVRRLPEVHGAYLMAGKKTEVINVQDLPANLAEKSARQIFAKVPGVFVYDMDGSGNQVNIATRGLDPHRSWEFNVRQNGIMINSDIYGYPASHYSPPMEAIQRVELVRGTASLQYGAEFGGMINYVIKEPDTSRTVSFESLNSAGSYGLFSSYNALGGKLGRLSYYAYYQHRTSEGYRDNSRSRAQAQYIGLRYDLSARLRVRAELGRSTYRYQIPGPLTDSMFYADPRQSTWSRNHYSPDIYVPSLTFDWELNDRTTLQWVASAVLGTRSSVQFIGFADRPDRPDPATGQYSPRQVDIDHFNSYTSELRLLHRHQAGPFPAVLAAGLRYIDNDLHRQQLGKGTTGSDYDLSLSEPRFGRDLHYRTHNGAVFAEYLLELFPGLRLAPGIRYEYGRTRMSGAIQYLPPEAVPLAIDHRFPLLGVNLQYQFPKGPRLYGGWSQAYRPVIFADVIPPTPLDRTDSNLRNARGYNMEAGLNGQLAEWLHYDLSWFRMRYDDRIGSQVLRDATGEAYVFKTNLGSSQTDGLECYLEARPLQGRTTSLSLFTATSYMSASYRTGRLVVGGEDFSLAGNRLETVPRWITRNGLSAGYRTFSATLQYSYVAESFSDALNTQEPTPNGARGPVPGYGLWDLNTAVRFGQHYIARIGINNLTNKQYFTKRPTGYPGPGVWPSDGRSVVASLGVRI